AGLLDALIGNPCISIIPPATYLEMMWLVQNSRFVATDSVGVQVEAYLAGKSSVVLRRETEHTTLVEMGWSKVVDPFDVVMG
ncbi:UDP-N-acetylglucosamine 2-epimerase, partial [Salmonella sp. SAL4433]|uniref:UDP-N-acetylglucosamine 2-epimerase n=1 Tax=Salmonella sp. SAL4433 TaxID=3159888 RepID=UPI00397AAB47